MRVDLQMYQHAKQVVRVLIADDSDIAVSIMGRQLEEDPRIRVVGRARNGLELLDLARDTTPDVVLLDMLMPEVGGLSALRHVVTCAPVVVVSSEPADSLLAKEALAQGATSFICKSELAAPIGAAKLRQAVCAAERRDTGVRGPVVLVAGSTGAIQPLIGLVKALRDIAVPILIVQHLPKGRDDALVKTLKLAGVPACVAKQGDPLEPRVHIAPSDCHVEIDRRERIALTVSAPVNGHRPSAEVTFASAVSLGRRVIAIMLPGLGNDGAHAMGLLAAEGACCLALDPVDCGAPSMPLAALAASRLIRAVRATDLGTRIRRTLGHV